MSFSTAHKKQFMLPLSDSSGSIEMNVDGSVTPVEFKLQPPADENYLVHRAILYIEDSGSFDSGFWGNGITMANGIDFCLVIDGKESTCTPFPWKMIGDVAAVAYDFDHKKIGAGNEWAASRLSFDKFGDGVPLSGQRGDYLLMRINDDLTGLVRQHLTAEGERSKITA